jgi:TonB-dependent starch-binding outer membrane protein SusC
MKKKFTFLKMFLIFILAVTLTQVHAQEKKITGKIIDETGNTMTGATVRIKGTEKGAISDVNGIYTILADTGSTLQISFAGYMTEEVVVGESGIMDINLIPTIESLEEVVVVGYGVQKKSLVTGSISKVKTEDIVSTPALRIEQALQGRTSGVVFNQTSGNPGAQVTAHIRGVSSNSTSEPLFIIDGLKTSKNVMNEIDPSDIESVEVLKDGASAAIYGSEGANGVIIITTKSGTGKKDHTEIVYDAYYGFQKASPVEVMDANQYREYFAEAYAYNKRYSSATGLDGPANAINKLYDIYASPTDSITFKYNTPEYKYDLLKSKLDEALSNESITQAQYDKNLNAINLKKALSFNEYKASAYRTNSKYTPFVGNIDTLSQGTNWMDEIFQVAPMQKHHLSVTTSTEKSNLYLSASYFTQDGVVGGSKNNFTRYNIRVNADHQAKKWLKLGTHLTLAQSKSRNLPVNDIYNNVVLSAMCFDPTAPMYYNSYDEIPDVFKPLADSMLTNSDGKYYSISNATSGERVNPFAKIEVEQNNTTTTERAIGDIYAEIKLLKDITYRFSYSAELSIVTADNWQPKFYYTGEFRNHHSFVNKEIQHYFKRQADNVLTYNKTFGDHSLNVMIGMSFEKYTAYNARSQRSDLFVEADNFAIIDNTPVTTDNQLLQQTGGWRDIRAMLSYFGRLNYNYKEKYLLSTTLRRDGSSMFEKNHRFGTFPSVSAGWNINRENFFDMPYVSLLKARASWGQNGSISNVYPYQWISTTTVQNGGNQVVKNATINRNLTWETSEQTDFGIDLGLFQNKLTLSVDYFNKKTKDLLAIPEAISWTVGAVPFQNVGTISNKGVEFDLGFSNHNREFKYDMKLTASYLKNEVTSFDAAELQGYVLFSGRQHTMFEVGQPAWYFQGYKVLGIFQNWEEIRNYTYTDPATGEVTLIQPDAQPGDPKIQDNGGAYDSKGNPIPDGVISALDYTYLGKPMPTWTFGFNFNCEYKGFDAGFFLYSELGKTIYNALTRDDRTYYNRPAIFYTERWTETNQSNSFIRATNENVGSGYSFGHNSLFFEDGSFLRLKNIQIGYTLPNTLTKNISIEKLRIYFSVNNLWTLTKYSGSDPEIGQPKENDSNNNYSNSYGVDMGLYPSSKQYLMGITATF